MADDHPTEKQITLLDRWLDSQNFSQLIPINEILEYSVKHKCSIYVLRMIGQWIYIGQTINLSSRMRDHLGRFQIASIRFLDLPADHLDKREAELIQSLQSLPFPFTHNKSFVSFPPTRGPLAQYMQPRQEKEFLSGKTAVFSPSRRDTSLTRYKNQRKFDLIRHWPRLGDVADAGHEYVKNCIPEPALLEGLFWMVSCLPYYNLNKKIQNDYDGTLFRINVFRQEVLFVISDTNSDLFAVGFLSPSVLDTAYPDLSLQHQELLKMAPSFLWEKRFWPSGGGDQQSFSVALADLASILRLPAFLCAVRRFVVGLARKGPVWWQQSHCPALADCFFDARRAVEAARRSE